MHPKPRQCLGLLLTLTRVLSLVSSQGCTLDQFKNSDWFDRNFDLTNLNQTYPSEKSVKVNCVTGYSGFFKMTCTGNQWTYKGRQCQPRSCGHPGDAQFGDFRLTLKEDFVFGSRVEYTCHIGHIMVSRRNTRNCLAQGWDGAVPVCEPLKCPAIYPDSNVLAEGDTENANYRNSVRFSCRSHKQILSGPQEITCNQHGVWTGGVPTCKDIECTPPNIPNGYITADAQKTLYKENEYLHYECNHRYMKPETRLPKCAKLDSEADWTPKPQCEPIKCRIELTADDREHNYEPPGKILFLPGETLSIRCGQKYWIGSRHSTSAVIRCQDDGTWTADSTCRKVLCTSHKPSHVQWWDVEWGQQVTLGDRTSYGCTSRYESTVNPSEAECTRDGWNPVSFCQEKMCDPVAVDNAVLRSDNRKYRLGERIYYNCMEGYSGQPQRTCTVHGFTGTSKCTGRRCSPPEIVDAQPQQTSKQAYNHGSKLQYKCNKSDYMFTVTCQGGEWEGIHDCSGCREVSLENGFVVLKNSSTIYYRCNQGYRLSTNLGWGVATCGDGIWNGFSGECIDDTVCGKPPVIPNGKLTGGHTVYVADSTVTVNCEEGFLAQVQNFICLNGEWNSRGTPLPDVCKTDPTYCGTPPRVENAVVITPAKLFPANSQVTYQCRHNFNQEGDSRSVCTNGQWNVNLTCTSLKCRLPVTTADQSTRYDPPYKYDFLSGETLSIQCSDRYWIGSRHNASVETRCQDDGTWTVDPTCREVVCSSEKPSSVHSWYLQQEQVPLGHKTQYRCIPGYAKTDERNEAECTRDGWSPDPLCRAKCQLQATTDTREHTYEPLKYVFLSGETLSIQCSDRYGIGSRHNASVVTRCQDNGTWTVDPTCREVVCSSEKPTGVEQWSIQEGRQVRLREKTRYECSSGYESTDKFTEAECTRDGWSPDPLCRAKCRLEVTTADQSTRYDPPYKYDFLSGETLSIQCSDRYWIGSRHNTSAVTRCQDDGTWTVDPTCRKDFCTTGKPTGVYRWHVQEGQQVPLGLRTQYQCSRGYEATSSRAECTRDGWSPVTLCRVAGY